MFAMTVSAYPPAPNFWGEVEVFYGMRVEMAAAMAYEGLSVMKEEEDRA